MTTVATPHREHGHTPAPGHAEHKADHLARLSKIEGQVRGISRMVTDDRYRIGVLTRISAAGRTLQEVAPASSTTTDAAASPTPPAPAPPGPSRSTPNSPAPCGAPCVCEGCRTGR